VTIEAKAKDVRRPWGDYENDRVKRNGKTLRGGGQFPIGGYENSSKKKNEWRGGEDTKEGKNAGTRSIPKIERRGCTKIGAINMRKSSKIKKVSKNIALIPFQIQRKRGKKEKGISALKYQKRQKENLISRF